MAPAFETAPDAVVLDGLRFVPMIPAVTIAAAVDGVAAAIAVRHRQSNPLLVCVLSGAAPFHAELMRRLPFALEVDYLRVASYNGELRSSGNVRFTAEPCAPAAGRHVVLVEDIVDTGRTVARLRSYYAQRGAASVEVAALLYKREADLIGHVPEYIGIEIPDRFVVGFGLDYRGHGRNLPAVYVLDGPAAPSGGPVSPLEAE